MLSSSSPAPAPLSTTSTSAITSSSVAAGITSNDVTTHKRKSKSTSSVKETQDKTSSKSSSLSSSNHNQMRKRKSKNQLQLQQEQYNNGNINIMNDNDAAYDKMLQEINDEEGVQIVCDDEKDSDDDTHSNDVLSPLLTNKVPRLPALNSVSSISSLLYRSTLDPVTSLSKSSSNHHGDSFTTSASLSASSSDLSLHDDNKYMNMISNINDDSADEDDDINVSSPQDCDKMFTNPWTVEEDSILLEKQQELGNNWVKIASYLTNRSRTDVKTRFKSISRARQKLWSIEEDSLLYQLHDKYKGNWATIAANFPNRTRNAVKVRYKELSKLQAEPESLKPPPLGSPAQIFFRRRQMQFQEFQNIFKRTPSQLSLASNSSKPSESPAKKKTNKVKSESMDYFQNSVLLQDSNTATIQQQQQSTSAMNSMVVPSVLDPSQPVEIKSQMPVMKAQHDQLLSQHTSAFAMNIAPSPNNNSNNNNIMDYSTHSQKVPAGSPLKPDRRLVASLYPNQDQLNTSNFSLNPPSSTSTPPTFQDQQYLQQQFQQRLYQYQLQQQIQQQKQQHHQQILQQQQQLYQQMLNSKAEGASAATAGAPTLLPTASAMRLTNGAQVAIVGPQPLDDAVVQLFSKDPGGLDIDDDEMNKLMFS